jgi:UDP-glucose 4-epimerase
MHMHVVVTGGAGFIGVHTSRALLARGHRVTALDDLSHGKQEAVPEGARLIVRDVRTPEAIADLADLRPDAVLHLAAQMDVRRSVADPAFDASVNVVGTVNVLEAARAAGVRRVVFASTGGAIYGEQEQFPAAEGHPRRPASPYGVSKLCGEEYLAYAARAHGIPALALRYSNVYGPGQDPHGEAGVVAIFCGRLLRGEPPIINGDGLQTRDYVHVEDVAAANCAALESTAGGALNIGTGREATVVEVCGLLARELGFQRPPIHAAAKPGEQRRSSIDPSAARTALGWEPRVELAAGLAQTARWFRDRT